MVNLAQQITDTSLKLYLPLTQKEGRAHRYESIFRTGIEVIKTNATTSDDELVAKVAGNILKRLDRIGIAVTRGQHQHRLTSRTCLLRVRSRLDQPVDDARVSK